MLFHRHIWMLGLSAWLLLPLGCGGEPPLSPTPAQSPQVTEPPEQTSTPPLSPPPSPSSTPHATPTESPAITPALTPSVTPSDTPELTPTLPIDQDGDGSTLEEGDCDDEDPRSYPGAQDIPYDGIDQSCDGEDLIDVDQDGVVASEAGGPDCDDLDANTYPGATEFLDGKDNDCDGTPDDAVDVVDNDLDGYSEAQGDCNDADPKLHPGAQELPYDGIDQDCTGIDLTDVDEDGYPGGDTGQDCDDTAPNIHPDAEELPYDGIDQDCLDGDLVDVDEDGFAALVAGGSDCDDENPAANPEADERCNGLDDDCDGQVDVHAVDAHTYYTDADGDTYGDPGAPVQACGLRPGLVENATDCHDGAASTFPGAPELCDQADNNCDGQVDEAVKTSFYQDADGDHFGNPSVVVEQCSQPSGYVSNGADCDDTRSSVYPNASEVCDGLDNNCDSAIDEGVKTLYYQDADGDGVGVSGSTTLACNQPAGYAAVAGDCNDASASSYPGASEVCDGLDNNCDSAIDEGVKTLYYQDADGDGFGVSGSTTQACNQPAGYAAVAGDCNDASASTYPTASERCNGLDEDCDVLIDEGFTNSDGDSLADCVDGCPLDAANDADTDGVCGNLDNCVSTANSSQSDLDADGIGDACDTESCDGLDNDGDGSLDEGFMNTDGDAQADCVDSDDDGDTVVDGQDPAPLNVMVCGDSDVDGCDDCAQAGKPTPSGDGADADADGICDLTDVANGSSQLKAGYSCGAILDAGYSTGDGVYWVDPDLGSGSNAFQVYCDMTTDGGGWMLVGKVGESSVRTEDFSSDRDVPSLLSGAAPTSTLYAHYNLGRFDADGSAWMFRSRVDAYNNGTHYQSQYFQVKQGGTLSPRTAGTSWRGTSTRTQLVYLNRSTTSGQNNTTWLPVDRFDDVSAGLPTFYIFGHRRADLSNNCLSANGAAGQTQICHSPAGLVSSESTLAGTYTAAYGVGDGVTHSWNRRATYWLRDTTTRANGLTLLNPARSCQALYTAGVRTSGLYWVDPDGGSSSNAVQAYCDQSTDGGGWTLGVNIAADLGAINLFTYNNRTSDPLNTSYGINLSTMNLSSSTVYRLACVESSDNTTRRLFISGLNPAEPIFQAAGTITKTNIVCAQNPELTGGYTGQACIISNYEDDNHTYYGNAAWDMDWALYKLGSAYTLRHCANRGNGYWNKGTLWFR